MKYAIFYLLEGSIKKYHQKLMKEVGPKYGENYVVEIKLPSHITLKSPFKTSKKKLLIETLEKFMKNQSKSKIKIKGFGNFRKFVVFLNVVFSKKAKKIQKELWKELKEKGIIKPRKEDTNFKPHATITFCNSKDTFLLIWRELIQKKQPFFEISLDKLCLAKKPGKYWKVHKVFNIK
jgi:2'-5' RNA ligase